MTAILTRLRDCLKDDRGVTLVEYGIALALALLVGTATLTALGGEIAAALGVAGAEMPN
ncbi:hypothetical protein [Aliiroseovarius sp.]|uniref:Flp family type IVb pilin n=1 Tax=Aliiroseovarius sp. TaxID=1872442 RepID=UPI00261CCD98|nr:hypothetical protein [Aliiroseovarius sp.]